MAVPHGTSEAVVNCCHSGRPPPRALSVPRRCFNRGQSGEVFPSVKSGQVPGVHLSPQIRQWFRQSPPRPIRRATTGPSLRPRSTAATQAPEALPLFPPPASLPAPFASPHRLARSSQRHGAPSPPNLYLAVANILRRPAASNCPAAPSLRPGWAPVGRSEDPILHPKIPVPQAGQTP